MCRSEESFEESVLFSPSTLMWVPGIDQTLSARLETSAFTN